MSTTEVRRSPTGQYHGVARCVDSLKYGVGHGSFTYAYTLASHYGCPLSIVDVLCRSSITNLTLTWRGGHHQNMRARKIGSWSRLDTMHLKRDYSDKLRGRIL